MKKKYKLFAFFLIFFGLLCIAFFFVNNFINKPVYTITFDTQGGSIINSVQVAEGEKIAVPSNPVKENYDFVQWEYKNVLYDFNLPVKEDMTLKALWELQVIEPSKYDVSFKIDDVTKTINVEKFSDINMDELGFENKNGYVIVWYLDGKEYDESKELDSNISLEGKYVKVEKYTIKFNTNGGTKVQNQTVKTGEKIEEPTNVTKEGFVLDGWYLDDEKYNFDAKVYHGFTLVAKWSEDTNIKWYTVSFDSDGGSEVKSQKIKENTTAIKPGNPTKKNFIFDKWNYNDKEFDFKTKVTEDIELRAIWREPVKYQVTFQYDDGTEYLKREVLEGETVLKPTDPTKANSQFVEWQLDGKTFKFDTKINKNITLKAKFNAVETNCTVSFNTAGGSELASRVVKCGVITTKPIDPVKIGYKFIKWNYSGQEFDFSTPITKDMTLDAIYEEKNCTIVFNGNGGVDATTRVVPYGVVIENPPTSTRENYTFVEWRLNGSKFDFTKPITGDTCNITLKAEWQPNSTE